ncbi:MAG: alcohol dehydrogenase catalytic domain-containing protein, partial [Alphaproteobacteria bacterium]
MKALLIKGERDIAVDDIDAPPPPAPGQVQLRIRAVALNHIDVWGWRGMAFVRRKLPMIAGAEAAGEVV